MDYSENIWVVEKEKVRKESSSEDDTSKENSLEEIPSNKHAADVTSTSISQTIEDDLKTSLLTKKNEISIFSRYDRKRKFAICNFPKDLNEYVYLYEKMLNNSDQFGIMFRSRCATEFTLHIESFTESKAIDTSHCDRAGTDHVNLASKNYEGWNNCCTHIAEFCKYIPDAIMKVNEIRETMCHNDDQISVQAAYSFRGTFIDFDGIFDKLLATPIPTPIMERSSNIPQFLFKNTSNSSNDEVNAAELGIEELINIADFDSLFSDENELELFLDRRSDSFHEKQYDNLQNQRYVESDAYTTADSIDLESFPPDEFEYTVGVDILSQFIRFDANPTELQKNYCKKSSVGMYNIDISGIMNMIIDPTTLKVNKIQFHFDIN